MNPRSINVDSFTIKPVLGLESRTGELRDRHFTDVASNASYRCNNIVYLGYLTKLLIGGVGGRGLLHPSPSAQYSR